MSVAAVAENRQTAEARARRLRFGTSLESRGLVGMPFHNFPAGVAPLVADIEGLRALMAESPRLRRLYEPILRDAMRLLACRGYAAMRLARWGEVEKVFRFLRLDRVRPEAAPVYRRAFVEVMGRTGGRVKFLRKAIWRTAQLMLAELSEEGEAVTPTWRAAIARQKKLTERRRRLDGRRARGFAAAQGREVAVSKVFNDAGREGRGQRPPEIVLSVADEVGRDLAARREWDARMASARLSENERAVLNLMRDEDLDDEEACKRCRVTRRVYQNAARKVREVKLLAM